MAAGSIGGAVATSDADIITAEDGVAVDGKPVCAVPSDGAQADEAVCAGSVLIDKRGAARSPQAARNIGKNNVVHKQLERQERMLCKLNVWWRVDTFDDGITRSMCTALPILELASGDNLDLVRPGTRNQR
jgi:hypothetical protein